MMFAEETVHRVTSIFEMPVHDFNAQAKFTTIEEVYNKSLSKLKIHRLLKQKIWILKLQAQVIPKTLLGSFGSHIKTRFRTPSCPFHSSSNLITWMSYAQFI